MQSKACAKRVRPTAKDPVVIKLTTDGFEARDLSATGAGIFVPTHLEGCALKSPVHLVIKLPESEPIRARGRIVHRTKLGREFLGVEFMHLSEAHAAAIARYVERVSQSPGKVNAPSPRTNVQSRRCA
jgi:c-di-GMP-binding flagellar brake protein YcgR